MARRRTSKPDTAKQRHNDDVEAEPTRNGLRSAQHTQTPSSASESREHRGHQASRPMIPPAPPMDSSDEETPLRQRRRVNEDTLDGQHDDAHNGNQQEPTITTMHPPNTTDSEQSDENNSADEDGVEDNETRSKRAERYAQQIPYFRGTDELIGGRGAQNTNLERTADSQRGFAGPSDRQEPRRRLRYSDADIVAPEVPGAHVGLKVQSPAVQSVVRRAILLVFVSFCFEHAFAYSSGGDEHANDKPYIRRALIKAAERCHQPDIGLRLQENDRYAKSLSSIVQDRIDDWRSKLRHYASCAVASAYGLQRFQGVELEAYLNEILVRGDPNYIYLFAQDEHGKPNYNKPFLHPIFAQVLHSTFFHSSKQMGHKCREAFKVAGAPDTYELPAPLVALAGTAVFAALDFLRASPHRKFSADAYADVYSDDLDTLNNLSSEPGTKDAYHPLMAKIFSMAQNGVDVSDHRQALKGSGVKEIDLND